MKSRSSIALIASSFVFAASATWAAGDHKHDHSPKHGGIVVEVKDIDLEFVLKSDLIQMHVRGHKAVKLDGATAKLSLLAGSTKTDVVLSVAGDKFEAKGKFDVDKGTKGIAVVTLAGQAPRTARFEVKK